jgi:hypothetical protein
MSVVPVLGSGDSRAAGVRQVQPSLILLPGLADSLWLLPVSPIPSPGWRQLRRRGTAPIGFGMAAPMPARVDNG